MAFALLGSSPPEPQLLEAARSAAEDIIYFDRVQRHRRSALEAAAVDGHPPSGPQADLARAFSRATRVIEPEARARAAREMLAKHFSDVPSDSKRDAEGSRAVLSAMERLDKELRRLWDYDRRAFSRRAKSLRELDYRRVEVERRRSKS
ncbi:hypothetical protein [Aestuariivirga sp.]|uniref:hypothetical protein n=1 Tax=Aestuariivirga sp. TaxID=2650926 RepID=UPI003BA8B866